MTRLSGQRASTLRDRTVEWFLLGCGILSLFVTGGIVLILLVESAGFFSQVQLKQFLLDTEWTPLFENKRFGIWPLVVGTLLTSVIAISVALPFGVLAAIYLSEYASAKTRKILKPLLELLAGIPTIVFGYFALVFVTPVLQKFIPHLAGFNALSAGILMGLMIIPIVSSLSEDALHAVPRALREGAYALGAGKLETIRRVVLPAARSGLIAAFILGVSRAVGETMIVAIAAGQQPNLTLDPRAPIETMTAYIVQVSMGDIPANSLEYRTLYVVGASLFLMTLVLNLLTQYFRRRISS
ncbi:MAG: Phosphate transport system permease protein PstC 1 [Myxococcota bacterium]|nr:Phosphate transport system permease protein PstC 1 [Myxococcota bacterium]